MKKPGKLKRLKMTFDRKQRELRIAENKYLRYVNSSIFQRKMDGDRLSMLTRMRGISRAGFIQAAKRLDNALEDAGLGFRRFPWKIGRGWKYTWGTEEQVVGVSRYIQAFNSVNKKTYSVHTDFVALIKNNSEKIVELVLSADSNGFSFQTLRVLGIKIDVRKIDAETAFAFLCPWVPKDEVLDKVELLLSLYLLRSMA